MIISYDQEVDALYIRFQDTTVTTKQLAEGLAADYDATGHLAGLEILDVSTRLQNKNTFRQVSWNFKHILNLGKIKQFNAVNLKEGYQILEIRTPKEVVKDE